MQKEASVSPHSQAHPVAALSRDELIQERTAIVALLNNFHCPHSHTLLIRQPLRTPAHLHNA